MSDFDQMRTFVPPPAPWKGRFRTSRFMSHIGFNFQMGPQLPKPWQWPIACLFRNASPKAHNPNPKTAGAHSNSSFGHGIGPRVVDCRTRQFDTKYHTAQAGPTTWPCKKGNRTLRTLQKCPPPWKRPRPAPPPLGRGEIWLSAVAVAGRQ